jgi:hypothetical protein
MPTSGINAAHVRYKLNAVLPDGSILEVPSSIIDTITTEELTTELAVRVTISMQNALTPFGLMNEVMALGVHLQLMSDWGEGYTEVWQGICWSTGLRASNREGMRLEITAYDVLRRLTQSKDDYMTNAGDDPMVFLKQVLTDYEYQIGTVFPFGPDATLPQYKFTGSLAELISTVFQNVMTKSGGEFFMRARLGKIEIVPPGQNTPIYYVDGNICDEWDDTEDMSQLITEIRVGSVAPPGPADDTPDHLAQPGELSVDPQGQVITGPYRQRFGKIREVLNTASQQSVDDPSSLSETAQIMMDSRGEPQRVQKVSMPDLPFIRRGDYIHFHVGTLDGRYVISGLTRDVANRRMALTINSSGTIDYRKIKRQSNQGVGGPADEDQSVRVRTYPEIPLKTQAGGTAAIAAQATAEARSVEQSSGGGVDTGDDGF